MVKHICDFIVMMLAKYGKLIFLWNGVRIKQETTITQKMHK